MAGKTTFGAQFWLCPSGGTLVKLPDVTSISAPATTRGVVDITTHDSAGGVQEFIADGIYDPGEMSVTWNHVGNSTADTALTTAITTGAKQDFKIVDKAASGDELLTGSCIVTSYQVSELGLTGKQIATATFKVTGATTSA